MLFQTLPKLLFWCEDIRDSYLVKEVPAHRGRRRCFLGTKLCSCQPQARHFLWPPTLHYSSFSCTWTPPKAWDISLDHRHHRVPWTKDGFEIESMCLRTMDTLVVPWRNIFTKFNYHYFQVFTLLRVFLESIFAHPWLCSVITHLNGWYGDVVIGDGETTLEDIYLETLFQLHPLSPWQTAFIPVFSQVSGTLPSTKVSPCVTGTWHFRTRGLCSSCLCVCLFVLFSNEWLWRLERVK